MKRKLRDYFEILLFALILALLVRTFFIGTFRIPSSSMAPTLLPGDFVFSAKASYGLKVPFTNWRLLAQEPQRGDLIVFKYANNPHTIYVKRVIGLPGDHLVIRNNVVYINETEFKQSAISEAPVLEKLHGGEFWQMFSEEHGRSLYHILLAREQKPQHLGPLVVPPGEVFVMGDNRDASDDSRFWGTVPLGQIQGRVFLVWLSLDWSQATNKQSERSDWPVVRSERLFKNPDKILFAK